jgi:hypothetical protein
MSGTSGAPGRLGESTAARLRLQLDALSAILSGVPPDALTRRPAAGEWSALENLAHVARHHEVLVSRVGRILREAAPDLGRYRAEDDPEWPGWVGLPSDEVLGQLRDRRRRLIQLMEGLAPGELGRVGVHPVFGPMPVPLWLEHFLLHEAHHLYVVMGLVRRLR